MRHYQRVDRGDEHPQPDVKLARLDGERPLNVLLHHQSPLFGVAPVEDLSQPTGYRDAAAAGEADAPARGVGVRFRASAWS